MAVVNGANNNFILVEKDDSNADAIACMAIKPVSAKPKVAPKAASIARPIPVNVNNPPMTFPDNDDGDWNFDDVSDPPHGHDRVFKFGTFRNKTF